MAAYLTDISPGMTASYCITRPHPLTSPRTKPLNPLGLAKPPPFLFRFQATFSVSPAGEKKKSSLLVTQPTETKQRTINFPVPSRQSLEQKIVGSVAAKRWVMNPLPCEEIGRSKRSEPQRGGEKENRGKSDATLKRRWKFEIETNLYTAYGGIQG